MDQELRLRRAEPADYDRIVAVLDDWWGRPIRGALPRLFLDHFAPTSLVAEQGGGLAGFLVGLLSPARSEEAYIHFVGVDPAFRGHGLARRLYTRFFELAAADGRTSVRAITSPQNHGSIAFHQAMGFTAGEPIADYDGPSAARVLFHLRLDG